MIRRVTEALPGGRSFNELRDLVTAEAKSRFGADRDGQWVWVRDMSDTWAVVEVEGVGPPEPGYYQVTYTVDDAGGITLGEPSKVEARTTYTVTEATIPGRLVEAKGTDDVGGRVFGFRVVEGGTIGRNSRRYPESVLVAATGLYEGAKCFDRHRTEAELRSSTISGMVGYWRNARVVEGGLDADLHLFPSATHTAEALDASLAAQAAGLPSLAGASHDVLGRWRVVVEANRRIEEATEIAQVNSVDVVADPAAGGRVTRMVAGGIEPEEPEPEKKEPPMDWDTLMKLLGEATDEQKAQLATSLGVASGASTTTTTTPAATATADPPAESTEKKEPVLVGVAEGGVFARDTILGRQLVRAALAEVGVGTDNLTRAAEAVTPKLPERFTEAELATLLALAAPGFEAAGLRPQVQVSKDERDRKTEALDAMFVSDPFDPKAGTGYRSLAQAYLDITGTDPRRFDGPGTEDLSRHILRESLGPVAYDSGRRTESVDTATWAQVLGDSITRRTVAEYRTESLQTWRRIVSSIVPLGDFRTQRITRLGGYGAVLPVVPQGAPYQNLVSPPDEEVTYAPEKRGGLEDLTWETIRNDDMRAVQSIPKSLGRTDAHTLYRLVFDLLSTNPAIYDSVALFAAGHANTDSSAALAEATLDAGRLKMRSQAAYGNALEILNLIPQTLLVPAALEATAFRLTQPRAVPSSGLATDIANLHASLVPLVVPYWTDTNDWFLVADPSMAPTIEVGFLDGRQDPEIFVQSDPTVGSVFTADKITYKIRHVYGVAVLDYRSFYRGQG